jgi:hypothetical protein
MNGNEWNIWTEHHAALFQMHSDTDVKMFIAWRPLLDGYSLNELRAASNYLASNVQAFRTDHLRLLRLHIMGKRRDAQHLLDEARGEVSNVCDLCGGIGSVLVPHPACIRDGEFGPHPLSGRKEIAAVYCACERGRRGYEIQKTRASEDTRCKVMTCLGQYEIRNPGWMNQWKEYEAEKNAEIEARTLAAKADALHPLGNLVGRAFSQLTK